MRNNPKPGPKSLSERSGEETRTIKVTLTQSQYDYVMSQPVSASHYCRTVIDICMNYRKFNKAGIAPSTKEFYNWYREQIVQQYNASNAAEIDDLLTWLDTLRIFVIDLGLN